MTPNNRLDQTVVAKLKEKYAHLHPLLFHRSLERATSSGELFDILDTVPPTMPLVWDDHARRWINPQDLMLSFDFNVE